MSDEDTAFMPNTTGNTNCGFPTPAHLLYVGDVPWQYQPPAPWYGQPQVPVTLTTGTSTAQQVWPFSNVDELREFVKSVVRETLEEDARAIRERKEFQPTKQAGICHACLFSGDDMERFEQGGQGVWIHKTDECRQRAIAIAEHKG